MNSVDKKENDLPDSKRKMVRGKAHGKQIRGELQYSFSEPVLETALHSLAHRGQEAHGIHVECIGGGVLESLPEDMHVLFFLTIRELLMNIVRHTNARHATISMSREESQIRINVVDDGIGFNTTGLTRKPQKNDGFGLFSIGKRVGRLGGRLDLISQPGQGTQAVVAVPERRNPISTKHLSGIKNIVTCYTAKCFWIGFASGRRLLPTSRRWPAC